MGFLGCCAQLCFPNPFLSASDILRLLRNLVFFLFNLFGFFHFPQILRSRDSFHSAATSAAAVTRPREASASVIRELLPVFLFGESGENACMCAVCLFEFSKEEEIRCMRNCKHIFHRSCVDRWINDNHKTCPLCRTPFVPDHNTQSL